jgi:hypothetical protein
MCIAILNTQGTISKDSIDNSYANNNHGAGFAYSRGDKFFVFKTDKGSDAFYKAYKKHRKNNSDVPFLLHFRISTHGTITKDNLHPFVVGDVAMIHNGMVDITDHKRTDHRSDTRYLCEEILADLPSGWHNSKGMHALLGEIGGWSKFVFLHLDNSYAIVNESAGHWADGNWYSNSSYKQVNSFVDYGGKKVEKSTFGYGSSYGTGYSAGTSYGSSKKTSSATAGLSLSETTLIEKYVRENHKLPNNEYIIANYVEKEVADEFKMVEDYVNSLGVDYDDLIVNEVWYNIEGQFSSAMNVELNGKTYTVAKSKSSNSYTRYSVLPFSINSNQLLSAYLRELEKNNVGAYKTATEILTEALFQCPDLFDNAEGFRWNSLQNSCTVDSACGTDYCDGCLEPNAEDDLKGRNGLKLCKSCLVEPVVYTW